MVVLSFGLVSIGVVVFGIIISFKLKGWFIFLKEKFIWKLIFLVIVRVLVWWILRFIFLEVVRIDGLKIVFNFFGNFFILGIILILLVVNFIIKV